MYVHVCCYVMHYSSLQCSNPPLPSPSHSNGDARECIEPEGRRWPFSGWGQTGEPLPIIIIRCARKPVNVRWALYKVSLLNLITLQSKDSDCHTSRYNYTGILLCKAFSTRKAYIHIIIWYSQNVDYGIQLLCNYVMCNYTCTWLYYSRVVLLSATLFLVATL